jgi:phage baseplate assembly protein W
MPQYIGFSTINACQPKTTNLPTGNNGGVGSLLQGVNPGKKFRLTDEAVVIRDFINALNIPQGQKVGQPSYGTTLYSFVFEPNTADNQFKLETEIKRVASLDSRLNVNELKAFTLENGILLEIEISVSPFNQARLLNLFVDQRTNSAYIQ